MILDCITHGINPCTSPRTNSVQTPYPVRMLFSFWLLSPLKHYFLISSQNAESTELPAGRTRNDLFLVLRKVCGSKRLSCHAGHQEANKCCTGNQLYTGDEARKQSDPPWLRNPWQTLPEVKISVVSVALQKGLLSSKFLFLKIINLKAVQNPELFSFSERSFFF